MGGAHGGERPRLGELAARRALAAGAPLFGCLVRNCLSYFLDFSFRTTTVVLFPNEIV